LLSTFALQRGSMMAQLGRDAGAAPKPRFRAEGHLTRLEFRPPLDGPRAMKQTDGMQDTENTNWLWGRWSRLALSTALVTMAVDQANKLWMLGVYRIQDRGQVRVTPFLDFVYVVNTGISYNIGSGAVPPWALSAFAVVASAAMAVWVARAATGSLMALSVGLIIGGAIGNAIDRLWLGGVADFYLLHAFGFSWYVFNIADVAIVAGVVGLLYDSFVPSRAGAANAP